MTESGRPHLPDQPLDETWWQRCEPRVLPPPDVPIRGGIPSIALLPSVVGETDFERLLEETLAIAAGRSHLILGVADATPPEASLDRVCEITKRVNG